MKKRITTSKLISIVCLLIITVLSITVISPWMSSLEFHAANIEKIDNKKLEAMTLSAAVTAASVAISAIPDDVGSSVADELDDLTAILFVVVCVLYLEMYMLTIMNYFSFSFLVPLSCILFGINLLVAKTELRIWATRLLALALVFVLTVPVSVKFTTMLEDVFSEKIDQTLDAVYRIVEDNSGEDADVNAFVKFFEKIKETVVDVADAAKKMLSLFVDAVAVLIVSSCVVPIITAVIFVWIIKNIFRIPLDMSRALISANTYIKGHLSLKKSSLHLDDSNEDVAS